MSEPIETTTLYGAQVELGGKDAPYSEATVRRMIRDGVLDSYGRGVLLLQLVKCDTSHYFDTILQ